MIRINNNWEFIFHWSDSFGRGEGRAEPVRLPHTVKELPLHYADRAEYETICGYRRRLFLPAEAQDKRVFLQFDAAGHIAEIYCNDRRMAVHRCGYTSFRVEITDVVRWGEENLLSVKLDTRENPAVPPFGFLIDYLTYGGLYRDVWLDLRPREMLEDVFVSTPSLTSAHICCQGAPGPVRYEIYDGSSLVASEESDSGGVLLSVPDARPWSLSSPNLYRCRVTHLGSGDTLETTFGFRTARFRADGFYLNGEKVFLRGLNRHQCYPYVGYAAPETLQREDARILRRELKCNFVRTSHYPQSPYFIDQCDREGLLVFTEIPGWQHIGDASWQDQAVENVREMVMQYRNHPSVILWGVRINESLDDDALYQRTNATAHELDPTRPTSGVRYLENSSLLEDVYAYNDFSHDGNNPGVKPREEVLSDPYAPLLITESIGHTFPTKPYDPWAKRQEHALRHARVLDDAMADGAHVGISTWCMFDYATHRQFGSGDRICYHGVMDAFRNPKLAAAVYASQSEEEPVLEVGSSMDIGDYPVGKIDRVYAFTNAEEVALYKNNLFVGRFSPHGWKALAHGPIWIDDMVGQQLQSMEGFDKSRAEELRRCLLDAGKYGLENLPEEKQLALNTCLEHCRIDYDAFLALYNKYVASWGGDSAVWRFDALRGGKVAVSLTRGPSSRLHLQVKTSHTALTEGDCYDMAAVRIRVLDEYGNLAPYAQLPIQLTLSGEAELAGPSLLTLEGGSGGTYVRTTGKSGEALLTIAAPQTEPVSVSFTIEAKTASGEASYA